MRTNIEAILDFRLRVAGYVRDNVNHVRETIAEPSAQDMLDHWDTNGPEGVGEALTPEYREEFLAAADRALRGEFYEDLSQRTA